MIKHRSYTFNSSSFFNRDAAITILALFLVVIFSESLARFLKSKGIIFEDPRLPTTIEKYTDTIKVETPEVWFVGNSTLDYSLDEKQWSSQTGVTSIKMPLGGATVRATLSMLEYYVNTSAQKPKTLILFITKDDLNTNGSRAKNSITYIERSWDVPWYDTMITLRMCQKSIRNLFGTLISDLGKQYRNQSTTNTSIATFNGIDLDLEDTHLKGLSNSYQVDVGIVEMLSQKTSHLGIQRVLIVFPPVTKQYDNWHNRHYPSVTIDKVFNDLEIGLQKNGFTILNYRSYFNEPALFRDSYHLNELGKKKFTDILASHYQAYK